MSIKLDRKRLKNRRVELDFTQEELGNKIGVSFQTINTWENNPPKNFNPSKLELLSSALECDSRWLTGDVKQQGRPILDSNTNEIIAIGVHAFAGAGGPVELFEHDPIQIIHIPKHWLKKNLQAVLIRGRSMEPTIMDGAVVGIDTEDKRVVSGELYAIWLEYEGAVVKRLYTEKDFVRITSDNPAFQEMQIKNEEINGENFILGKMSWLMQSY